jgi:hypothetical protein
MKQFDEVWQEIMYQVKKHQVLYAPETRKMQVIDVVLDDTISFTTDPTKKSDPIVVRKSDFERVWQALEEKGEIREAELRPLVGFDKMEFIWTVMNRLDYCEYDLRRLKVI